MISWIEELSTVSAVHNYRTKQACTASGVVAFSNEIKLGLQNGTYEPHGAYTLAGQFNIPLVKFNVLLDTNE